MMKNQFLACGVVPFFLALVVAACADEAKREESTSSESALNEAKVCRNVVCTPGWDGTELRCAVNPERPNEPVCVPVTADQDAGASGDASTIDPCANVACTPGFDGTELHCIANPQNPTEPTCVPVE